MQDPFRFRDACQEAYDQLYMQLTEFMVTPLSNFEILKVKALQGGQNALSKIQIEKEIETF